jgi:hypothetical protein
LRPFVRIDPAALFERHIPPANGSASSPWVGRFFYFCVFRQHNTQVATVVESDASLEL